MSGSSSLQHPLLRVSIHRISLPHPPPPAPPLAAWFGGGCWGDELWLATCQSRRGQGAMHQWDVPAPCASQWGHVERRRIKREPNLRSHTDRHPAETQPNTQSLTGKIRILIWDKICWAETLFSFYSLLFSQSEAWFWGNIWKLQT